MTNGEEQLLACASSTLSRIEQALSQINKQALGIMFGVKLFHQYLFGQKFILASDCKPSLIHF